MVGFGGVRLSRPFGSICCFSAHHIVVILPIDSARDSKSFMMRAEASHPRRYLGPEPRALPAAGPGQGQGQQVDTCGPVSARGMTPSSRLCACQCCCSRPLGRLVLHKRVRHFIARSLASPDWAAGRRGAPGSSRQALRPTLHRRAGRRAEATASDAIPSPIAVLHGASSVFFATVSSSLFVCPSLCVSVPRPLCLCFSVPKSSCLSGYFPSGLSDSDSQLSQ